MLILKYPHLFSNLNIKKLNNSSDIDNDLITVNNFFAHWLKEISITKYGSDKELAPTFSPWEVYQYSDQLLKHQPTNALKAIQKTSFTVKNLSILQAKLTIEEIITFQV